MITPRQMLLNSSKYNLKCPYSMNATSITIHNTANKASANNEIQYMITNDTSTSYHFAIDDKEVVQGLPLNRNGWHAGDGSKENSGNRTSIGIEICYSLNGGEQYDKAELLTIKFVAQLLKERNWGIDRVKKHQDWSGKVCPHRILAKTSGWANFLHAIQVELDLLNKVEKPQENKVIEYKDKKFINSKDYQVDSMKWAVDKGYINGDEKGQIFMDENISKGDLAVILKNMNK